MKKLATIERIHSITTHPNADLLSCAKVKAWPIVIKKDQFKENDLVVFIVIDSIVPADNPYFSFLSKQKYRVWSAKFRKMPSMGLACPIKELLPDGNYQEGDDVTEALQIQKFEKPVDLSFNVSAKGGFPSNLISITDELNILSYPDVVNEFRGKECYLSTKQDGSSLTFIDNNGETKVCSRRLELKEESSFYQICLKYDLPNKLNGKNVALQFEFCGPKLQGNPLELKEADIFCFNAKNLSTGEWIGLDGMTEICSVIGVKTVPIIQRFVFDDSWNIDRLQEIANNLKYPNGKLAEGCVLRSVQPVWSEILSKNLSVKILNQDYN